MVSPTVTCSPESPIASTSMRNPMKQSGAFRAVWNAPFSCSSGESALNGLQIFSQTYHINSPKDIVQDGGVVVRDTCSDNHTDYLDTILDIKMLRKILSIRCAQIPLRLNKAVQLTAESPYMFRHSHPPDLFWRVVFCGRILQNTLIYAPNTSYCRRGPPHTGQFSGMESPVMIYPQMGQT